jgi:hypothetical protein
LHDVAVQIAPVPTNHERSTLTFLDGVEDRLKKVLNIVWLLEDRDLLTEA